MTPPAKASEVLMDRKTPATTVKTDLRSGALGLPSTIMQGVASIAPAFAIFSTFQFTVSVAGVAAPVAYFITLLILLTLTGSVSQLAKAFPSAGGWYTWISRTVHPRAGFISAWMLSIWLPPTGAFVFAFIGETILQPGIKSQYGVNIPWWVFVIVGLVIVFWAMYGGIVLSGRLMIVTGLLEIAIMVALAISGLSHAGSGGLNARPFDPSAAPSFHALYLAVVFSIFAFSGWEAVAPIAEESKNPRRNVPLGLVLSVVILGVYFVFTSWAYLVGLGTNHASSVATQTTSPIFTLAVAVWHSGWVILLFALVNSSIAVSLAMGNAVTRTWYAMARSDVLPKPLAKVSPRRRVPDNAIHVLVVYAAIGFVFACIFGAQDVFFVWGLVTTLGLILMYVLANIGVVRHYLLGPGRPSFNPWLHAVFPAISTVAVVWVAYKSLVPLPAAPESAAPIVFGIYVLAGVIVLIFLAVRGHEDWLSRAGLAMETAESDDVEVGTHAKFAE
jgi:amino acid transporter